MLQKQSAGGIFSKTEEFIKFLKKAQNSESDYIKTYSKHVKASIKHAKATEKHTANLKALDSIMPDGFDSFLQTFNKTVSPEIRLTKKTDTTSPLLLSNYKLNGIADKDDLARDHLWHQCYYVLKTKFAPQDSVLVTKLNIADHNKSTFTMAITGVTFGKDSRRTINHVNYNANLADIRTNLADIISNIKKDVMEQVVQESVFAAPIETTPDLLTTGPGFPKTKPKEDPIPDIYGVKALLDTPKITDTKPKFGDNKPTFGEKQPDFGGRPGYLDQIPIITEKPPKPPIEEEAKNINQPIDAPDNEFVQKHGPKKEFGDFGKSPNFREPQRDFKQRDRPSGRRPDNERRQSRKRYSGNRGSRGSQQGKPKQNRPAFRDHGDKRHTARFNRKHQGSRKGSQPRRSQPRRSQPRRSQPRGPPPPAPDI